LDETTSLISTNTTTAYAFNPNPTNKFLTIIIPEVSDIFIYDIKGNLLLKEHNINYNHQIDISEFQNGVYFIKVSNDDNAFASKVIKQ